MKTAEEMVRMMIQATHLLEMDEEHARRMLEAWRQEIRAGAFLEAAAITERIRKSILDMKVENEK